MMWLQLYLWCLWIVLHSSSQHYTAGMYLTGTILQSPSIDRFYRTRLRGEEVESLRAFVQFDRGCITTTKCSCGNWNWCSHVLALCLARMNESAPLQLHPPMSETLTNLDREQLQKLIQYVLEKLPLHGVAAVQEVASSLLDKQSEINQIPGAPGKYSLYLVCILEHVQNLETALAGALEQMSLVNDYQTFRPNPGSSSVIVRYRAW